MDKEKICTSISGQLDDIREQFEIIRGYEGKIPSIELDLILSNIREVYEHLRHLEKANSPAVSFSVEEKAPGKVHEPVPEPEPEPEPVVFRVSEPVRPVVAPPPPPPAEEAVAETVIEEEPEVVLPEPEPVPVAEFVPETVVPETPPAPPRHEETEPKPVKTTLDLFGEATPTLADKLKDNTEKRVADRLTSGKVNDLKAVIGINEKFLYINELFDGSLRDYDEAVNKLNACSDPDEAGMIIFELRERYHWDLDNPAVRSFIELVNRKF